MKASMAWQGYGLTVQAQDAIQAMGVDISQDDALQLLTTFSDKGEMLDFGSFARRAGSTRNAKFWTVIHSRQVLRSRIIQAVQPGTIQWSSKLKSFASQRCEGVLSRLMDGKAAEHCWWVQMVSFPQFVGQAGIVSITSPVCRSSCG